MRLLGNLVPIALIVAVSCGGGGQPRVKTAEEALMDATTVNWCRDLDQAYQDGDSGEAKRQLQESDISGLTPSLVKFVTALRTLSEAPGASNRDQLRAISTIFAACENHMRQMAADSRAEQQAEENSFG